MHSTALPPSRLFGGGKHEKKKERGACGTILLGYDKIAMLQAFPPRRESIAFISSHAPVQHPSEMQRC